MHARSLVSAPGTYFLLTFVVHTVWTLSRSASNHICFLLLMIYNNFFILVTVHCCVFYVAYCYYLYTVLVTSLCKHFLYWLIDWLIDYVFWILLQQCCMQIESGKPLDAARGFTIDSLRQQGYTAVFLAIGKLYTLPSTAMHFTHLMHSSIYFLHHTAEHRLYSCRPFQGRWERVMAYRVHKM